MNILIIGAGKISKWFLNDLKNSQYHNEIIVKGIYNRTIEKAVAYQEKYQIEKVYQTIQQEIDEQAIDEQAIDLFYVATADDAHFEIVKLLLENNKNVFCEKPLALTYREAKLLYQMASEKKYYYYYYYLKV